MYKCQGEKAELCKRNTNNSSVAHVPLLESGGLQEIVAVRHTPLHTSLLKQTEVIGHMDQIKIPDEGFMDT